MNYLSSQRTSKMHKFLKFVELYVPAIQCEEYLQIMARNAPNNPPEYNEEELLVSTEHLVSNTAFNIPIGKANGSKQMVPAQNWPAQTKATSRFKPPRFK